MGGAAHPHPLLGVGLVFLAATLFAVNGTVSKLVLENGLSSLRLVEIRCVAATVIFALIAARRPSSLRLGRREVGFIAVYGIVGLAMVQWLYFVAITRMPVSVSLLIEFTAPLMVALWVRFVRKEPVRGRVWVALGLCLGGLVLVARVWAGLTLDGIGLITAALAAVSLAAYYMLGERGLGSRDPFSLATWSFGAAGLFWSLLLPWWTFPFDRLGGSVQVGGGGPHVVVGVLVGWVVVLGTVAPFGLVLVGLRLIGAARTGLVGTAEPVMAGLVAWVVLGERLAPVQLVGAAVVMAGIVVAESARAPRPSAAAPVAEGLAP
jgi:drug/metabolite transporter (DMT)-like permease